MHTHASETLPGVYPRFVSGRQALYNADCLSISSHLAGGRSRFFALDASSLFSSPLFSCCTAMYHTTPDKIEHAWFSANTPWKKDVVDEERKVETGPQVAQPVV